MRNLVQQLMDDRPDDWLEYLEKDLKIHIVCDGDLASLKYNQFESPMTEPIVQQCRGMVVDTKAREVVAWPYNKFWNFGETLADKLDWGTAYIQEKLDGSLMILYWHDSEWKVASSGHPTAGGSFGSDPRTFREAFWGTWKALGMELPPASYIGRTLMFEFCDAPNRVIVRHDRPRIVLHGCRDGNGHEIAVRNLGALAIMRNYELVDEFAYSSTDEFLQAAADLDPIQQEGFVVVDAKFNRVKVKSPRYVTLHHMKGEATPRRAIELWQTGETQEVLAHFPEFASTILPVQEELDRIAEQAVKDFYEEMPRPSRKAFALAVKDRLWSSVLFKLLDHEQPTVDDAKAIMRRQTLASLERMLSL